MENDAERERESRSSVERPAELSQDKCSSQHKFSRFSQLKQRHAPPRPPAKGTRAKSYMRSLPVPKTIPLEYLYPPPPLSFPPFLSACARLPRGVAVGREVVRGADKSDCGQERARLPRGVAVGREVVRGAGDGAQQDDEGEVQVLQPVGVADELDKGAVEGKGEVFEGKGEGCDCA
eukprot:6181735-Pleurochrysis_carterae.AAC.1